MEGGGCENMVGEKEGLVGGHGGGEGGCDWVEGKEGVRAWWD